MNRHEHDAGDVLDAWIDEKVPLERLAEEAGDDALLELLLSARRAAPRLSAAEAAEVFATVGSAVRRRRMAAPGRRRTWFWAAAVAVILAVLAVTPWRHRAAPERTILKQMRFEAEYEGRVVRLEVIVSRVEPRKGGRHVAKPSL